MTADQVRQHIENGLPGARALVRSGDNVHFEAVVVSPLFEGQRTLKRHQLVYATLGDAMGGEIHALSLETLTPGEASARGA